MVIIIYICDASCGRGKTSSAINMIKENAGGERYLYITPFLNEVKRIKEECDGFIEPKAFGTKLDGIKYLFNKQKNIVSTHALFRNFDEECIDLAMGGDYVLVMDEVMNVVEEADISTDDMNTLLEKYVEVEDDGKVVWLYREYVGDFERYKEMADLETLYYYGKNMFVWTFPVSIFKAFKDVYILTYMFEAQNQCSYYKFYNVEYRNIYVVGAYPDCVFTSDVIEYPRVGYKGLITIIDNEKMNRIGEPLTALSYSWYRRNEWNANLKRIKNNLRIYFEKTKSADNMWATFKPYENKVKGKGYTKGFVSIGTRATNDYRHKFNIAYCVNIFMKPDIKDFFVKHGVVVDEESYALSEMIQWIFRSQIRDKKPITIYVPSRRMRQLLQDWIDKE